MQNNRIELHLFGFVGALVWISAQNIDAIHFFLLAYFVLFVKAYEFAAAISNALTQITQKNEQVVSRHE